MRIIACLLLFTGCGQAEKACLSAKDNARVAWGEVAVRYGLALKEAESAAEERAARLAALERRPDAPAEGKATLSAEGSEERAAAEALRQKVTDAEAVRDALASRPVAEVRALAATKAAALEGPDVAAALAKTESAATTCEGAE